MLQNPERLSAESFQPLSFPLKLHKVWLTIVGLIFLGICGYAAFTLWAILTDNFGTFHNTTDVADVDGDGDLDVIVHNVRQESEFTAFGGARLWTNQGNGTFVAGSFEYNGGWDSAAGDLDQDGDADLVVYNGYQMRTLLNQGGGQTEAGDAFENGQLVSTPPRRDNQFGSVLLGDLNGDEQLDGVVVGCCGRIFTLDPDDDTPNISWMWKNEVLSGGKPVSDLTILTALEGVTVRAGSLGDVDGDGDLDLFTAVIAPPEGRSTDPADRVLLNDGTGEFTDSGQRLGNWASTAVSLGDLDGDGDLDALVGTETGAVVWLNQGGTQNGRGGTFAPSTQSISGSKTQSLFLADLDDDGDLDALIGTRLQATVWWNDGQGTLTKSSLRFRYTKRHGLAVGDFDGNGRLDIFAGAYNTDYKVWLNQGSGTFHTSR